MNVSPCGSEGICTEVSKEPDNQLTTCSTCTVEGKCGRKMESTLGPNHGPRARVLLTHLNSFPFLVCASQ
jgi:positive regulator of sigma E activity